MKTRDKIAILAFIALVVFLVVRVAWRESAAPQPSRTTKPVSATTKRTHGPMEFKSFTGPTITFLGQTVPALAEPYLVSAVKCAKHIEEEAAKFPPNSHGYQMLKALERKLFLDDYAYAALVAGSGMDRTNGLAAFEKINEQAVPEKTAPLGAIPEVAQNLSSYYGQIVNYGHTGAYSNVVSVLGKYTDQNPLETDLFKDAALYASLREQANQWVERDQAETQRWVEHQSTVMPNNPAKREKLTSGFLALHSEEENDLRHLQEAYRNVFTYRLTERDGLTNPALFTDLDGVTLRNAGPELVIPTIPP
jgi:hypothetical protein